MSPVIELAPALRRARSRASAAAAVGAAASAAALSAPVPARLTGAWPEILWDLGCLGRLWIATAREEVRLAQVAALPGIRVGDRVALARGSRLTLGLFLDRLHTLGGQLGGADPHACRGHGCGGRCACRAGAGRDDRPGLWVEDAGGRRLLELTPTEAASDFALAALLRTHGLTQGPVVPDPCAERSDEAQTAPRLPGPWLPAEGRHPVELRQARWHALAGPDDPALPAFADIAELAGWLSLDAARLRDRGRVTLVDATLVPCLLEALADQALPVRIQTGTEGAVQGCTDAFHTCRKSGARVSIAGEEVHFELDTSAIESAWVLVEGEGPETRRQLRLYGGKEGDDGQALAFIDAPPPIAGHESPLWRTLVNALAD